MRHIRSPAASDAARSRSARASSLAKSAVVAVAEGDDGGAGQRGQVDQLRRPLAGGVDQPVGEDEAALGVGREDLDRDAVHRGQDVAGAEGLAGDHVLGGADHAVDRRARTPSARSADIAPSTAAPPAMSPFISSMPS